MVWATEAFLNYSTTKNGTGGGGKKLIKEAFRALRC